MKRLTSGASVLVMLLVSATPAIAATPPSGWQCPVVDAAARLGSPAAELRVNLDRALAEHAFLTIEQMRSGLVNGPDFAAAATAVEANSAEIVEAIDSVYGGDAAQRFGDIWRSHIGYLVDYARALGAGDTAAQSTAEAGLAVYRRNIARFFADANPGINLRQITDALDMHTAQLLEFIRAEQRGDHTGAYALEAEAYPHMFEIGDALARLIANRFPQRFGGVDVAYSVAGTLRVTLDRLLAEHAFLAAEAMRSGVIGAADFDAAKSAIDSNSAELQGVVAGAYGDSAAASFRTLWDGHIAGYYDYIDATRGGDSAARAQSTASVDAYAAQIATFLATANPALDAEALATMFRQHAAHLTSQVDAFTARDYDRTYAIVREGYAHMFTVGETLATGIATQLPHRFPADAGVPDTAMVMAQPRPADTTFPGLAVVAGTVAAALVLVRRERPGARSAP
jgi:hypothetical protein